MMLKENAEAIYYDMTNEEFSFIIQSAKIKLSDIARYLDVNISTLFRWRKKTILPIRINQILLDFIDEVAFAQMRINYRRRNSNQ